MSFNGSLYYRFFQLMGQAILGPIWRVRIRGKRNMPEHGGLVVISNHESFIDLILIGQSLRRQVTYLARDTLFKSLVFRSLTWPYPVMKIRRGEADLPAIREAIERLKRGELILLFPEGTRSRTGKIGPFTLGFYTMAHRAGVPVLPVRIRGSYRAWPRWQRLPMPGQVTLDIHPPMDVSNRSKEQVLEDLRKRVYFEE